MLYNQAGTRGSLTTSNKSITQGAAVSFTASLESTWAHRPAPTGTFNFYDNGTLLGTESVDAGSAVFETSALAVGSHTIAVSYSGDPNYNGHPQFGQVYVTVAAPATGPAPGTQPQIAISSPIPNIVLARGDSKTTTFTIAGTANYTGSVTFSVSGAHDGLGVSVSPTTVSLTNGSPVQVSVQVTTVAGTTAAAARSMPRWLGTTFGATALGLVFFGLPRRKRKSMWVCLFIVLCMGGLSLATTGCADGGPIKAKRGVSTVMVTATPSVSGASPQATSFTVTVQ